MMEVRQLWSRIVLVILRNSASPNIEDNDAKLRYFGSKVVLQLQLSLYLTTATQYSQVNIYFFPYVLYQKNSLMCTNTG